MTSSFLGVKAFSKTLEDYFIALLLSSILVLDALEIREYWLRGTGVPYGLGPLVKFFIDII